MQTTGSTILITGGGSGIGRGQKALDETVAAHPGMKALAVDLADPTAIRAFAARIAKEHPGLNVLINNAGIMRPENLLDQPAGVADAEAMIATNLLGPIRLTAALLPLLRAQPRATVMTVSSGLAFLPLAMTPTYCATKAAIHSWTQSLRHQLKSTAVGVLELIPPYVATGLMGSDRAADPRAMPLAEFIAEVMEIIQTQPTATEICVKRVHPLRTAAEGGPAKYDQIFQGLNAAMAAKPPTR